MAKRRVLVLLAPLMQCLISPTTDAFSFSTGIQSRPRFTVTPPKPQAHNTCDGLQSMLNRHPSDEGLDTHNVITNFVNGVIRPASFASILALAALSTQPAFAEDGSALSPTTPAAESTSKRTAYDDTWNLIKKYALDQSYNNQNWDEAYKKYLNGIDLSSTTDEELIMKATKNLVGSLGDKYTRILDKSAYAMIQKYDLIGVGATLMPNPTTKEIIIGSPPVPKSAGYEAGLKMGDAVIAVNGVKTAGRTAFDIIDQITEDPNSSVVTFTVRDKESNEMRDVVLKRAFMEAKDPVIYRVSETRSDGTKVGYVRIFEFNSLVKPRLEAALRDLESQDVDAYVIDVRGNPGGAFQSAVEIAGLFMSDTLATDVVDGNGVDLKFRTSKDRVVVDEKDPIVVWVDGRSASASEVLAGALRDNCRAVVMGDTSFGKGLVQAVYGLENGYGLVLTVAKYLTPNGTDINKVGIVPDISKEEGLPTALGFLPVVGSDTSRVDFKDVLKRMGPGMCSPAA